MCDYRFPNVPADLGPSYGYCDRPSAFWVQSLLSTHNSHACPQHLARIVREIEKEAAKYNILRTENTEGPDMRFLRVDSRTGQSQRITREESNYALVTVKTYTPKGR
jgi:hypothetical protein